MKQIGYFLWWQCCEWRNRFRAYWGSNRFSVWAVDGECVSGLQG
jgi:hypothetical protein